MHRIFGLTRIISQVYCLVRRTEKITFDIAAKIGCLEGISVAKGFERNQRGVGWRVLDHSVIYDYCLCRLKICLFLILHKSHCNMRIRP
ncbi:hypothetical protein IMSAG025_02220 [Muribaculaceae bacterium]|nr:hypothetical protein IMSAG025_02220 [Muribaculaceae bacterium]